MRVRSWLAGVLLHFGCAVAGAECPRIDIAPVALGATFERLEAAYTVTTPASTERWVLLVGRDATVNADGAPNGYEVDDHGTSYLWDGMCVRTAAGCVSRESCRSVGQLIAELPRVDDSLEVTCDGKFEIFRNVRFFGFLASPTRAEGYTDCGKTRLPFKIEPNGLRLLTPQTSLTLADGHAIPSQTVPFIVRPGNWNASVEESLRFHQADAAWVVAPFRDGDLFSEALVGDTGPEKKFGEGSIALHQLLTHGELVDAPAYVNVPGQRHPDLAKVPLPYQDRCDGDIRAKVSASGPWWYLIAPGSADDALRRAPDSTQLLSSLSARLQARTDAFGGFSCLRQRLHQAGITTNPQGRPTDSRLFGNAYGKCGRQSMPDDS